MRTISIWIIVMLLAAPVLVNAATMPSVMSPVDSRVVGCGGEQEFDSEGYALQMKIIGYILLFALIFWNYEQSQE